MIALESGRKIAEHFQVPESTLRLHKERCLAPSQKAEDEAQRLWAKLALLEDQLQELYACAKEQKQVTAGVNVVRAHIQLIELRLKRLGELEPRSAAPAPETATPNADVILLREVS